MTLRLAPTSVNFPIPSRTSSSFLSPAISTEQRNYAADVKAAQETASAGTFFVNVQTTSGEAINDLFFSQNNGQLFDGQVAHIQQR